MDRSRARAINAANIAEHDIGGSAPYWRFFEQWTTFGQMSAAGSRTTTTSMQNSLFSSVCDFNILSNMHWDQWFHLDHHWCGSHIRFNAWKQLFPPLDSLIYIKSRSDRSYLHYFNFPIRAFCILLLFGVYGEWRFVRWLSIDVASCEAIGERSKRIRNDVNMCIKYYKIQSVNKSRMVRAWNASFTYTQIGKRKCVCTEYGFVGQECV